MYEAVPMPTVYMVCDDTRGPAQTARSISAMDVSLDTLGIKPFYILSEVSPLFKYVKRCCEEVLGKFHFFIRKDQL